MLKGKWWKSGSFLGNSCVLEASEKTACAKKRDQSYFWCILYRFFEVKTKKVGTKTERKTLLKSLKTERANLNLEDERQNLLINGLNFWSLFHSFFFAICMSWGCNIYIVCTCSKKFTKDNIEGNLMCKNLFLMYK